MIKILDKYIIKKYLSTFFYAVIIFSLLACVIDFSDHLDNFMRSNAPIKSILFEYYLFFIPFFVGLVWPLFCLISVIFFTSRMAYNSEIISIINTGSSFGRLLRPYMMAATVLAGLNLLLNTYIIPKGSKIKTEFENVYIYKMTDKGKTQNVHLFTSPDSKVYIKRYSKRDSTAKDVMIEHFEEGRLKKILSAEKIKALPEGGKWKLIDYTERTFNGLREEMEEGKEKTMSINLLPEDFISYDNAKDAMTSQELHQYIERQRSRGAGGTQLYEVELHRRYAQPFIVYILTIIGMALSSRKVRGGIGLHLALGIALGSVYIFLFQFSITLSINGNFPPMLSVWMPSILFAFIALYLVLKAQK